jgi:hypothetical protein
MIIQICVKTCQVAGGIGFANPIFTQEHSGGWNTLDFSSNCGTHYDEQE